MLNIYAVIVIYNKSIRESITCKAIRAISNRNISVVVVDNSDQTNDNKQICYQNKWMYICMHENAGLSKAYNRVLNSLSFSNDDIIVWLDDDTNVTQEYFNVLEEAVRCNPSCDIFAPVIMGEDNKFWSPNEYHFLKNKQLKQINQNISNKKFNAINSCTAVKAKIYDNYRYDERLFLDQVDHLFFYDQRRFGRKFKKLDTVIFQNFSTKRIYSDYSLLKKRYKIMIKDYLLYSKITGYPLGLLKVFGWGVREGIKYRRIDFTVWCLREGIDVITNGL